MSVTHSSVRLQPINDTAQTYRCHGSNTTYSAPPPPLVSKCDLREVGMVFIFFTLMPHRTTPFAREREEFIIDRSFLSSLTTLLVLPVFHLHRRHHHCLTKPIPPLSPLLISHFPYLPLYNPFITTFPFTTSAINDLVIPPSPTATRPNPLYDEKFSRGPGSRPSVW